MEIVKEHVKKNKIFARFFHIHYMWNKFVGKIRSFYFVLSHYISLKYVGMIYEILFSFVQFRYVPFLFTSQEFTEF